MAGERGEAGAARPEPPRPMRQRLSLPIRALGRFLAFGGANPSLKMIKEVYDALVSAGVPDREARRAAEATAARAGPADAPLGGPGATVDVWRALIHVESACADRLNRLRAVGSALVALSVVVAVAIFGAYPDARLVVGPYPVHGSAALLALALLLLAQLAAGDWSERRRLAAALDDVEQFTARIAGALAALRAAAAGPQQSARPGGGGFGTDLIYVVEAALIAALLLALLEA